MAGASFHPAPAVRWAVLFALLAFPALAADRPAPAVDLADELSDDEVKAEEKAKGPPIRDPLRWFNRPVFAFNDKVYRYGLRPVSRGYCRVVPRPARRAIGNVFHNLAFPVRLAGNVLQAKPKGAGRECGRFIVNSTIGLGGLFDPAKSVCKLEKSEEDLGQTLGRWGVRPGCYIVWPVLGPSSPRDTLGMIGDGFLDPKNYVFPHDWELRLGVKALAMVNGADAQLGRYDALRADAVDPYTFMRDAYIQNRQKQVQE